MITRLLSICIAILFATSLHANPIIYQAKFVVTAIDPQRPCSFGLGAFGCNIHVGDVMIATFTIDDALLRNTGNNLPGVISNFLLQVGDMAFDQNHPYPQRFPFPIGLGIFDHFSSPGLGNPSPSPGFNVQNGAIVGLEGTVHGLGDALWVTFYNSNRFIATDAGAYSISGDLTLSPAKLKWGPDSASLVPEPSTFLLLAMGLLLMGWKVRRA